ncbi:TetR/AcrR family transcriptional regulator [Streptomyces sparsogenes]|uniref:TetR/AcrR family transcriptional regulator n=1 Tax=Streptomyces sparsogenes TaxID=67365 RepID=UPI003404B037
MARTAPSAPPKLGLRERKKIQTRRAIRGAAHRLFEEQGYDATPVDQIAEAADVSPSTVFRYFPTKEDIVLTDEYDPFVVAALRERPLDEPPVTSLRHALVGLMHQYAGDGREEMLTRLRLIRQVPALRARMGESLAGTGELLGEVLAERSGRAPDDFEVRVVVAAVLGALREALFFWFEDRRAEDGGVEDGRLEDGRLEDGRLEDMEKHIDRALEVLARGLTL